MKIESGSARTLKIGLPVFRNSSIRNSWRPDVDSVLRLRHSTADSDILSTASVRLGEV